MRNLRFLLTSTFFGIAAAQPPGWVVIPDSSVERPGDRGVNAHTNHLILVRPQFTGTSPSGETPQSIRPVYNLPSSGGSNIIAIVDAYDYPTAENDLNVFSSVLGLPPCTTANGCFTKIYASGHQPRTNCGWAQEASLDIEWAHAMAPNAKIVLVEAASNRFNDLFAAVDVASNYIASHTVPGEVSMSWGGGEFTQETLFDASFTTPGVVYIASSGDSPGAVWPSVSPNVVSAGGTTISRDPNSGTFLLENTWQDAGGGPSQVEARPHFQDRIAEIVGDFRGTPDFSFDANPNTGVWVLDTNLFEGKRHKWFVLGGTSVSAPSLAGIINAAGRFAASSQAENAFIYGHMFSERGDFRDIIFGNCGLNIGNFARLGWDFCTGVGSDFGLGGK